MTSKELALSAMMEERGYSNGLITTALFVLSQSREALDEMILFIDDNNPSEEDFVEHLAEICHNADIKF